MLRDEILEYPYSGTIKRVVQGRGRNEDSEYILYQGVMDEHMLTAENGKTLQTSSYIISIPLVKGSAASQMKSFDSSFNNDFDARVGAAGWVIPKKGDKIEIARYGETIAFVVDNSEPSQLGGVSIYATRNSW